MLNHLSQLKEGKDIYPGIIGVSLRAGNQYADPAVIGVVRANSPAYRAGFKPEDTIVEINGQKIVRQVQVKLALGPYYAGETVRVAVTRGKQRIERELELIEKLEPYSRPFLGVLPLRVASEEDEKPEPGVGVRYVYSGSGASVAGLEPGDRILAVDGKPIADRRALREAIAGHVAETKIKIKFRRGKNEINAEADLGSLPEVIPDKLPPAMPKRKPYIGKQPPTGRQSLKLAEFKNECVYYVPEGYDPAVPQGLVVWLHEPGGLQNDEAVDKLLERWRPICAARDLILIAPKSLDSTKWEPASEAAFVTKVIEKLRSDYNIDDTRIVAQGYQGGGAMAYYLAFNQRDVIRGAAAIDAPVAGRPPEHDPAHPLAFFVTTAKKGRTPEKNIQAAIGQLRNLKYPVSVIDQGDKARDLDDKELQQCVDWLDSLDRI